MKAKVMPKRKQHPPITAGDACVMMHTALRKACDSKPTSAAYNLIHLICDLPTLPAGQERFEPWTLYGKIVCEYLFQGHAAHVACSRAAGHLSDAMFDLAKTNEERREIPTQCRTAMHALTSVFALFTANDWHCMASYLTDEG